jgi:hypothetical protein
MFNPLRIKAHQGSVVTNASVACARMRMPLVPFHVISGKKNSRCAVREGEFSHELHELPTDEAKLAGTLWARMRAVACTRIHVMPCMPFVPLRVISGYKKQPLRL